MNYFLSIKSDLLSLTASVKLFVSSLVPNTKCDNAKACTIALPLRRYTDCACICPVKCNSTASYIFDRRNCACQYCEGYSKVFETRTLVQRTITEITQILRETETVVNLREELNTIVSRCSSLISTFEINYANSTTEEKIKLIEKLVADTKTVIVKCDTFKGQGPCNNKPCPRYNVIYKPDCTCYTTIQITEFVKKFSAEVTIENQVYSFNFRGNKTTEKYWEDKAKVIREYAAKFYGQIIENKLTTKQEEDVVITYTSMCDSFNAEWKAYQDSTRGTTKAPCSIPCSGDNVRNCATCTCSKIEGFNDLNTIVANGIAGLRLQIDDPAIPANVKDDLRANADSIKKGRDDLLAYIAEFCSNLDEKYVQLRCIELNGWYQKLQSDIEVLKNLSATKICPLSCPSSKYVYDPVACTCECTITGCSANIEVPDPYNCYCAKKSTCAVTEAACTADGNKILDYTNCVCKPKPVKP